MQSKKQKKKNESRKLKIQQKYFSRSYKTVVFPEIRLSGKWLLDAGFSSGDLIQVDCKKYEIIISKIVNCEGGQK